MVLLKSARGKFSYTGIYTAFSLSSYCSCSNLFSFIFFFPNPPIQKFSSFMYSYASCILTLYLHSFRFSLGHLSHQTPTKGGRRGCLAMNLLFRCHFLINAADKAIASHLMRRQYVNFHKKLLLNTLTFSLNAILSTRVSKRYFVPSFLLYGQTPSSGLKCFHLKNE